ncbi:MAG: tRNA (guanosine(37)-N1)-methyltransferase TrmD [Actinomycetota bacterium]
MSGKLSFDVISIFPEWFESPLKVGLLGKAIDSGVVSVGVHDLRDWGAGPHRKVDDAPFGGGPGMVMAAGPMVEAAEAFARPGAKILLTAAAGRPLTQGLVSELASREQIVILCGRYEGIDDRVRQVLGADEISIGEFVLSGGEVAALAIIEAVSRLVPGMVGRNISLSEESFGQGGLLEYPQYTRPAEFRGLRVPEVLLSGDHIQIARWRRREAIIKTAAIRPEHLEHSELSAEERAWAAGRD